METDMRRATITLPDEMQIAVEAYIRAQEATPTLNAVVQAALREFLDARGFLAPREPFWLTPAEHGSGHRDTSRDHDRVLAESIE
jgi:hypothetical protein